MCVGGFFSFGAQSMYAVFVPEWLRVMGRGATLVVRLEDLKEPSRRAGLLARANAHLGVAALSEEQLRAVAELPAQTARGPLPAGGDAPPPEPRARRMEPEARALLDAFFAPWNELLASVLLQPELRWGDGDAFM